MSEMRVLTLSNYRKWTKTTFDLCEQLWYRPHLEPDLSDLAKAVTLVPVTELSHPDSGDVDPFWSEIPLGFRKVDEDEVTRMGFDPKV